MKFTIKTSRGEAQLLTLVLQHVMFAGLLYYYVIARIVEKGSGVNLRPPTTRSPSNYDDKSERRRDPHNRVGNMAVQILLELLAPPPKDIST